MRQIVSGRRLAHDDGLWVPGSKHLSISNVTDQITTVIMLNYGPDIVRHPSSRIMLSIIGQIVPNNLFLVAVGISGENMTLYFAF